MWTNVLKILLLYVKFVNLHCLICFDAGLVMAPIIRTRQAEKTIDGIPTQVVCTEFSNYIFIVLTQYGKVGTLVSVTPDSRSSDISTPMLTTKVLLGKDEVLIRWGTYISNGGDRDSDFHFSLSFFFFSPGSYARLCKKRCSICLPGRRKSTCSFGVCA